jgi:hypothetical protein
MKRVFVQILTGIFLSATGIRGGVKKIRIVEQAPVGAGCGAAIAGNCVAGKY